MNTQISSDEPVTSGVSAAVFRGTKHIRKGMPCQDAYAAGLSGDGFIIMTVADGVSSSPHSEEAAGAAVKAVVDFWREFSSYFNEKSEIFSALQASMNYALLITDSLRKDDQEAYSYETTLSIVAVNPQKKEMYYSNAGDSGIYLLERDGTVESVAEIMREKDGSVYALSEGPEKWKFGARDISNTKAILMMTDGISDVIRSQGDGCKTAKRFMEGQKTEESYRDFCKKILSEDLFFNMDDDAAIVLYAPENIKTPPWNDDTVPDESEGNPETLETGPDSVSTIPKAFGGIRSAVKNIFFKKKDRRKE